MTKTCMNCINYHGNICDDTYEESYWHEHDYCEVWERVMPKMEYWGYLDAYWDELSERVEDLHIYDDFETGVACCYMFEEAPTNKQIDDGWFLNNLAHNRFLDKLYQQIDEEEAKDEQ